MEYIITFKNTNFAIKGERLLLDCGVNVTVMPLPSQIRAGCGICARIRQDELDRALNALREGGISETELYRRENIGGKFVYEKVAEEMD